MTRITSALLGIALMLALTSSAFPKAKTCCDGGPCCNGGACCRSHQHKK